MNYGELVEEVRLKVKSAEPAVLSLIPTYINTAISQIAEDVSLPFLEGYGAVTTVLNQAWVNMPSRFSGKLLYAGTADGEVKILDGGFVSLLALYPSLDQVGAVTEVALLGGNVLYYQGIPDTETIITLVYMQDPVVLVNNTDVPTCIPLLSHIDTIVPLAASYAFDKIESGDKAEKKSMMECLGEYSDGLARLMAWVHRRKSHVGSSKMVS